MPKLENKDIIDWLRDAWNNGIKGEKVTLTQLADAARIKFRDSTYTPAKVRGIMVCNTGFNERGSPIKPKKNDKAKREFVRPIPKGASTLPPLLSLLEPLRPGQPTQDPKSDPYRL